MEELIQYLLAVAPMSERLVAHLRTIIIELNFKKNQVILEKGEVCQFIFYMESGLVRSFYRVGKKEVSNWFMKEGDICISVLSFFRRVASADSIVALEDCRSWGITYEQLEKAYREFPEFNVHGRIIAGEYYCRSEERHLNNRGLTPEAKYEQLMTEQPDLLQRVNKRQIAAYLDVSHRTFYQIQKDFLEKQKMISKKNRRSGI